MLIAAAALLILAVSRNREHDLVSVGLDAAVADDEPRDPADDVAVTKARTEPSVPWDQARRELGRHESRRR